MTRGDNAGQTKLATATSKQTLRLEITVFQKDRGGLLSKRIRYSPRFRKPFSDGSPCKMTSGTAHRTKLGSVNELAALIDGMQSHEALTLGRLLPELPDNVLVRVKDKLKTSTSLDVIARTSEYLTFAEGLPAPMLLDADSKGQPKEIADKVKQAGGVWSVIVLVAPDLKQAARVERRSTSAGLFHVRTGRQFPASNDQHIYVAVADGSDIPRALKTLHDLLWLRGLGYMIVGKIGQLLERSIIDASVGSPERLVFEGQPDLGLELGQDAAIRRPRPFNGIAVDTTTALPSLTEAEQQQVDELKRVAKRRLKPEAEKARKVWALAFAERRGLSPEQAEQIAVAASEQHWLAAEWELEFDDDELGRCTVANVIANPEQYIKQSLADPLEGIGYGRGKAKVYRHDDGGLMIHSFAHGGINYRLGDDTDAGVGTGVTVDDFLAYMPTHRYIFIHTGELWPAASVDARIGRVYDPKAGRWMKASAFLDKHRPIEQITWVPGYPMVIEDWLVAGSGWINHEGVTCFNFYRPPTIDITAGDAHEADLGSTMSTKSTRTTLSTSFNISPIACSTRKRKSTTQWFSAASRA